MTIFHSIILGIIQGLAEFLPISSSAHLIIVPYLFHWDYQGLGFDVALHFGTALAIVVFFWKDWISILKNAFSKDAKSAGKEYPKNLLWQILVASIPAAILGIAIDKIVEQKLHSPLLIAIDLAVFGIVLWLFDKYSPKNRDIKQVTYKDSLIVGFAQALALIPGVSRSGITMVGSRGLGLKREEAARFGFLIGTPATLGAFLLELKDIQSSFLTLDFIVGVVVSFVFGLLAIKYLLEYLKRGNFAVFTWYRIAIAAVVIAAYLAR